MIAARARRLALLAALVALSSACSTAAHRSAAATTAVTTTTSETTSTATTTAIAASSHKSRVAVWGDSLTLQAADALRVQGRAHGFDLTVYAFFGLAACDVAPQIVPTLERNPPDALVLAFTGNNFSPCMAQNGKPMAGAAYFATYRRDIERLVDAASAHHVPVLLVGAPTFPAKENHPDRVELNHVYMEIAATRPGVSYASTAPAVSPLGFAARVACIAGETVALGCSNGLITVRTGNGIHFDDPHAVACPSANTSSDACRYTAGGHRYADAIIAGLAIPGLSYHPATSLAGVPIDTTQDG